jgi:hypothetical protein
MGPRHDPPRVRALHHVPDARRSFPPSDGGSHYIFSEMDEAFALIEGWAEVHAVRRWTTTAYGLDAYLGGRKKIIEDLVIADVQDYGDWDGKNHRRGDRQRYVGHLRRCERLRRPSWDDSGIGDQVDRMFPTLWSVMLQNSPDSIDEIWEHWPQHDQYIWPSSTTARIQLRHRVPDQSLRASPPPPLPGRGRAITRSR